MASWPGWVTGAASWTHSNCLLLSWSCRSKILLWRALSQSCSSACSPRLKSLLLQSMYRARYRHFRMLAYHVQRASQISRLLNHLCTMIWHKQDFSPSRTSYNGFFGANGGVDTTSCSRELRTKLCGSSTWSGLSDANDKPLWAFWACTLPSSKLS